ncbi:MAG: hypothetical protein Q8L93_01360, partial [Rhodocyclaceae bacterium]|nr:hypothetical protein [Rhodocyclaceae bacterium]
AGLEVCIGGEDASRADPDFLCRIVETAQRAGARRFRFADTLGILEPFGVHEKIGLLRAHCDLEIEMHAHDDLGLATANTLAAARAGATHLSFVYALLALSALQAGYFVAAWRESPVMPWLLAAVGVLMILIVVALSRISMRMVNAALDARGADADYLARPPRRNLATFAIGLFTVV